MVETPRIQAMKSLYLSLCDIIGLEQPAIASNLLKLGPYVFIEGKLDNECET